MNDKPPFPADCRSPGLDEIAAIAESAIATIPAELAAHTKGLVIAVEEICDEQTERDMELASPFELLGLYHGRSLDQKSALDVVQDVDRIFLYRRAILDFWAETGETLSDIVRNVIIHEIGHHFGLSDDDMEALERDGG
jgi:predicted Zn-dependent protease with MMP-like domain